MDGRPPPVWFTEIIRLLCADGGWEDSIYEEFAMRIHLPHFSCSNADSFHLAAAVTQALYAKSESVPPNFVAIGDSVMQSNPSYGFGATKEPSPSPVCLQRFDRRNPLPFLLSCSSISSTYEQTGHGMAQKRPNMCSTPLSRMRARKRRTTPCLWGCC